MTHVHEFRQVIWVQTPMGDGIAVLHIDYGAQHNGTLLVIIQRTGELKYFDTNQVRASRNDTMGISVTDDQQQPYKVTTPINNPVKPVVEEPAPADGNSTMSIFHPVGPVEYRRREVWSNGKPRHR